MSGNHNFADVPINFGGNQEQPLARLVVTSIKQYVINKPMKKGIVTLSALIVSIMVVALTPVGPIFVYGWLVPIIGPLMPKPEGVPSHAEASFQWKGYGVVWSWEDAVSGGCAQWWAAEGSPGPARGVDIFEGSRNCEDGVRTMSRLSFEDTTSYGTAGIDWSNKDCPFTLTEAAINRYRNQVDDLRKLNNGILVTRMLDAMQSELKVIDGKNLIAQQNGCRIAQD